MAGVFLLFAAGLVAQAQQNPSPMVEHTREHPRLEKTVPAGQRNTLELGTLFVPETLKQKRQVSYCCSFMVGTGSPSLLSHSSTIWR